MKNKKEKERREEDKVSRKLRVGNYHNFSLFVLIFCWFELGLKLVLIDWLWSSIEEFLFFAISHPN